MKIYSLYWWFWWLKRWEPPPTPWRYSDLPDHVRARLALNSTPPEKVCETTVNWLYQLLGLLDTKASALMRLNSVMVAAAAFVLNPQFGSWQSMKYLIAGSALLSAFSIAICLLVVAVDWPFLGLVKKIPLSDGKVKWQFAKELFHLQKMVDFRRRFYVS